MPEGDSLRAAASRLRVLAGQHVAVEAPHPRAAALGIAPRLDGKRLEHVEAVGKNLLLTFEGGLVLRSHLMMSGRWRVGAAGRPRAGRPWLVLRGREHEATLWNGPVLELSRAGRPGAIDRLGPDIMARPAPIDAILARMARADRGLALGEALLDQRLVAGIGNLWRAEVLFAAGVSPWARLGEVEEERLRHVLETAALAMHGGRRERAVYRRTGLPCRRCGTTIRARRQGERARTAYWCPGCQAGTDPGGA